MRTRLLALISAFAFALPTHAIAQTKPRIEKAADLPRFSYKVEGNVEDILRDDAKFARFAADVRRDAESVLRDYQIDDRATLGHVCGSRISWARRTSSCIVAINASTPSKRSMPRMRSTKDTSTSTSYSSRSSRSST